MYRITRAQLRQIKRLSLNELDKWLKEFYVEAFDDGRLTGYAEGLTADLDDDEFVVVDESVARQRLSDDEFAKLLGEQYA